MAEFDIMPYSGQGGQHCEVGSGSIDSAASFLKGEPVELDANGDLIEASDEPDVSGAAAIGSAGLGIAMSGASATAVAGLRDVTSTSRSDAETENVQLSFVEFKRGDRYIVPAANFASDNDTSLNDTVAAGNKGDLCSLRTDGTDWGVCVHVDSSNRQFRITQLIDANGGIAQRTGLAINSIIIRCEV